MALYNFRYIQSGRNNMNSVVRGCGLERPNKAGLVEGDHLLLSAWVLPKVASDIVKLVITDKEGGSREIEPSVNRLDVLNRFGVDPGIVDAQLGFSHELNLRNVIKISFRVGSDVFDVWQVEPEASIRPQENAAGRVWRNVHRDRKAVSRRPMVDSATLAASLKVTSVEDFLKEKGFSESRCDELRGAFDALKSPFWAINAIQSIERENALRLPGLSGNQNVFCRFSHSVDDYNYLCFSNDNDVYYLVQHCTNVCIIVPENLTVIQLSAVSSWVDVSLRKLSVVFDFILNNERYFLQLIMGDCRGTFLGISLTQSRPYHYFYDYMTGLNCLLERTTSSYLVYGIEGFDFFDPSGLSPRIRYETVLQPDFNNLLLTGGYYVIMPCVQHYVSDYDRDLRLLSNKLLALSESLVEDRLMLDRTDYELVVWAGISIEKRSWIEQMEGFTHIFREINERYGKVAILVDGRTFPLHPRSGDFASKSKEDALYARLRDDNPALSFFNLIGKTASEKIAYASVCDFFISNYATDSIYPSAVCGKPGVVFAAPSMGGERRLHVHHKIVEIPSERVRAADEGNKPWHASSVSMDWQDVMESILLLMEEYGITPSRM